MKRILLLGKDGQLGWELQRSLAPLADVISLGRAGLLTTASSVETSEDALYGDLGDVERVAATVRALRPDVIVNAAAYTAVDKAESERETAMAINGRAPGRLACVSAEIGALLVHYSTDYVFSGAGSEAWREDDATSPLSVYGQSKLEGEEHIRASGCAHVILRSSWIYAVRGRNFPKTMLRLAIERASLNVVSDQIGAPTGADLLADITAHVLRVLEQRPDLGGTYHATAMGATSRHEYACCVIEQARSHGQPVKVQPGAITPVSSVDYPTQAQRPKNSRLNCSKLESAFGLHMPPWQHGVQRLVSELLGASERRQ